MSSSLKDLAISLLDWGLVLSWSLGLLGGVLIAAVGVAPFPMWLIREDCIADSAEGESGSSGEVRAVSVEEDPEPTRRRW